MDDDGPKTRVNGAMLRDYQGRNVCLMGRVASVDQNGYSFQLTASDDQVIHVQLQEPLQDMINGLIEVQGSVTGVNKVMCFNYIQFPEEMSQNFDMEQYNQALLLERQCPDL